MGWRWDDRDRLSEQGPTTTGPWTHPPKHGQLTQVSAHMPQSKSNSVQVSQEEEIQFQQRSRPIHAKPSGGLCQDRSAHDLESGVADTSQTSFNEPSDEMRCIFYHDLAILLQTQANFTYALRTTVSISRIQCHMPVLCVALAFKVPQDCAHTRHARPDYDDQGCLFSWSTRPSPRRPCVSHRSASCRTLGCAPRDVDLSFFRKDLPRKVKMVHPAFAHPYAC